MATTLADYWKDVQGNTLTPKMSSARSILGEDSLDALRSLEEWHVEALTRWGVGLEVLYFVRASEYIVTKDFWQSVVEVFYNADDSTTSQSRSWRAAARADREFADWAENSGYDTMQSFILMCLPAYDAFTPADVAAIDKRIDIVEISRLVAERVPVKVIVQALDQNVDIELVYALVNGGSA